MKHNIIGIPFVTKYIPTIKTLNSRIHIEQNYTRMKNTGSTFLQKINKQQPFFFQFVPHIQSGTETPETTSRLYL